MEFTDLTQNLYAHYSETIETIETLKGESLKSLII